MRIEHKIIQKWITPGSRVLDLGCGDGNLLKLLSASKAVHGYGVEINPENISRCVQNQVNVIEQDLDEGLDNFTDQSFDTVIMSEAIQALKNPDKTLLEMLRVGRQCIVTFPNFGHWRTRLHLALRGRMPVSDRLPFNWYDTPNIHFCTFRDFDVMCDQLKLNTLNREVVTSKFFGGLLQRIRPNLFGETALYRVSR